MNAFAPITRRTERLRTERAARALAIAQDLTLDELDWLYMELTAHAVPLLARRAAETEALRAQLRIIDGGRADQ